jgi:YjbE family integral membrane protein
VIDGAAWIVVLVQIFCVDLLLGADNAVVIALACTRLPAEETRRAVMLGAVGAIALRLGMLAFANALLDVPLVKLVAAWTLIVIALNVRARRAGDDRLATAGRAGAGDFVAAAAIIMLADAAMSLDNVVALASIAGGSFWLLALGVALSIPIIAFGSLILSGIIRRAPAILTLGAVVLGWIAGEMAVSDPLVVGWVQANAPALAVFAPTLGAAFVWLAGERAERRSPRRAIEPARAVRTPSPPRPAVATPSPTATRLVAVYDPVPEPAPCEDLLPVVATEPHPTQASGGWSEERTVVVGFVILAALAGLIIFVASFLDSLT